MATAQPVPWGTHDDIEQYRRDVARFFDRLALASANNPPAGTNAANGYFLKAVGDDAEIKAVSPPRKTADDPEGQKIFAALASFGAQVQEAMKLGTVPGRWTTNAKLALAAFDAVKDGLPQIVKDIVGLVKLNPASAEDLVKTINDLSEKIHNSGLKYDGEHGNGHVQEKVNAAATQLKNVLDGVEAHPVDPFAGEFAKVLNGVLAKLLALPADKNDPWLLGEWQIAFQGIMAAGAKALYSLREGSTVAPPAT